jgi:hypothetical protein
VERLRPCSRRYTQFYGLLRAPSAQELDKDLEAAGIPKWTPDITSSPQAELSHRDAQFVIAREYGFASWPKLKGHVEALRPDELAALRSQNPIWLFQGNDVSGRDFSGASIDELAKHNFDSRTKWPDTARLPHGFDPSQVMETGLNPGLGIRALHAKGVTGKNVLKIGIR